AAWNSFRIPARGICLRLSARGVGVFCCLSTLGLAPTLLYRWLARVTSALRPRGRERVRGVGADAPRQLEPARPRDRLELEDLPLPRRLDDDDELHIARYAGHVSNLPAA